MLGPVPGVHGRERPDRTAPDVTFCTGGISWYRKQPPERRDLIRKTAGQVGTHLMRTTTRAPTRPACSSAAAWFPSPPQDDGVGDLAGARAGAQVAVRRLARRPAQPGRAAAVADLRAYLRAHHTMVLRQVRRGGLVFGYHSELPGAPPPQQHPTGFSHPAPSALATPHSSASSAPGPASYLTARRLTGWMSGARASRSADTSASAAGIWPLMCAVRASPVAKVSKMP